MNRRQDGFVLVSVLWVIALLTVITLSYHHRARLEVQAARYSLDSSQAMMAARGAVRRGVVDLRNKAILDAQRVTVMTSGTPAASTGSATDLGQPWARPHDLYKEGGLIDREPGFEQDHITYQIEDLERYININRSSESMLEDLPGISRSVARRIQFQRSGTNDAGAANEEGPVKFHDVAELRHLRGVDDNDWYGKGDKPGLRDLLTTYGDGRININTASEAVLSALPDVGDQVAHDILEVRNGNDGLPGTADDRGFRDWDTFSDATKVSGSALVSLKRLCKFDSEYFKITGVATRRGGKIRSSCAAVVHLPPGSGVATVVSWTEESLGS